MKRVNGILASVTLTLCCSFHAPFVYAEAGSNWPHGAFDSADEKIAALKPVTTAGTAENEVNFGPYMAEIQRSIKRAWFPPKGDESKRVIVVFKIHTDGFLSDLRLDKSSGVPLADGAALTAVKEASPMPSLPKGSPDNVDIQFTFDYNVFNSRAGKNLDAVLKEIQDKPGDHSRELAAAELRAASGFADTGKYDEAKGHYAKALALYKTAFGADSKEVGSALRQQAEHFYSARGQTAQAKQLIDQATQIAMHRNDPAELAGCRVAQANLVEVPAKNWAKAEQLYKQSLDAVRARPDLAAAYYKVIKSLSKCYTAQNKNDQAIALLKGYQAETFNQGPSTSEYCVKAARDLATIYMENHQVEQAISNIETLQSDYEKKYGANSAPALQALQAATFIAMDSKDEKLYQKYKQKYRDVIEANTLSSWQRAISVKPSAENYLGYAIALRNIGKNEAAKEECKKALEVEPNNAQVKAQLEKLEAAPKPPVIHTANASDASETADEGTAKPDGGKSPSSTEKSASTAGAGSSSQSTNSSSASSPPQKKITYTGTNRSAFLNNEGVKLLGANDFPGAIAKFTEALKEDPDYKYARENLAIAYNNLALKTPPQGALALFHKSLTLNFSSTTMQNIDSLKKTLKIPDINADDALNLARHCELKGDIAGAAAEYRLAAQMTNDSNIQTAADELAQQATIAMFGKRSANLDNLLGKTNGYIHDVSLQEIPAIEPQDPAGDLASIPDKLDLPIKLRAPQPAPETNKAQSSESLPKQFEQGDSLIAQGKVLDGFLALRSALAQAKLSDTTSNADLAKQHKQLGEVLLHYAVEAKNDSRPRVAMARALNASIELRRSLALNPQDKETSALLAGTAGLAVQLHDCYQNNLIASSISLLAGKNDDAKTYYEKCKTLQPTSAETEKLGEKLKSAGAL